MNIQHRTAATLSLPGLSTTPELARTARNEGPGAREGLLAVTYEHEYRQMAVAGSINGTFRFFPI